MTRLILAALVLSGCTTAKELVILPLDLPARIKCIEPQSIPDTDGCYVFFDVCAKPKKKVVGSGCLPENASSDTADVEGGP